jgi:hypothetical protein
VGLAEIYFVLTSLLFLGTLIFAGIAGQAAERWAAGLIFAAMVACWVVGSGVTSYNLAIDALLAISLLSLFVRHKKLWLGCALNAQVLLLAFSSTRLIDFPLTTLEYVVMLNVSSVGVFTSLLFGTIHARWGRSPDADAEHWGYATPTAV